MYKVIKSINSATLETELNKYAKQGYKRVSTSVATVSHLNTHNAPTPQLVSEMIVLMWKKGEATDVQ